MIQEDLKYLGPTGAAHRLDIAEPPQNPAKLSQTIKGLAQRPAFDPISKAEHYNRHPSGVECIDIVKHHDFNIGNVIKYCWRHGLKGDAWTDALKDLKKARYYLDQAISLLGGAEDVVSEHDKYIASLRAQAQNAVTRMHSMTPAAFEIAFGAQAQKAAIEQTLKDLLIQDINVEDPPGTPPEDDDNIPSRAVPAYTVKPNDDLDGVLSPESAS